MIGSCFFSEFGSLKKFPKGKGKFSAGADQFKDERCVDDKVKKKCKENLEEGGGGENGDAVIGFIPVHKKLVNNAVSKEILLASQNSLGVSPTEAGSDEENEKRIEENEQFIIELLSKTQPHHDHCYTTIFGKRKNTDYIWTMLKNMGDEQDVETINLNFTKQMALRKGVPLFCTETKYQEQKPTPILFLRHRSPDENVPMVSKEEIIDDLIKAAETTDQGGVLDMDNTLSSGESKLFLSLFLFLLRAGYWFCICICKKITKPRTLKFCDNVSSSVRHPQRFC